MATPSTSLATLRIGNSSRRRVDSARRDELLESLVELLLSEGFARLTIDDMASRLQCSKATLYGLASSKESLVALVMRRFFRDATSAIEAGVAGVEDPAERIAAYLAGVGAEMGQMSPACYADMVSNDTTRAIYALNSAAAADRVRRFIDEGIHSGALRNVDAKFVGEAVSLLIDGIQHGELLNRTGLSSGEAFTALSDLVLAALTNTSRGTR